MFLWTGYWGENIGSSLQLLKLYLWIKVSKFESCIVGRKLP